MHPLSLLRNVTVSQNLRNILTYAPLDILITLIAFLAIFAVRLLGSLSVHVGGLVFIVIIAAFAPFVLGAFGVYRRIWSRTSGHGITLLVKATVVLGVVITLVNLAYVPHPLPHSVVLMGSIVAAGGYVTIRYRSRLLSGASWRWRAIWFHEFPPDAVTRVLIVGAGEAGQTLALRLKHRYTTRHYRVVGFIDDDPAKKDMFVESSKVFGSRADIPRIVKQHNVDMIAVAIHNISSADFHEIFNYCEQTSARIKVIPDVLALMDATHSPVLLRDVQLEDLIGRSAISRHEAVNLGYVMHKTILVTGAAGSIGSELSRQLVSYEPTTLVLLDNNESGLFDLEAELKAKYPEVRLVAVLADICQRAALAKVFATHQPQVIFHAAAYKHVPLLEDHPLEALRVNIGGTRNLAELAREHQLERFVLVSTDKAIHPTSVMGASKRVCEEFLGALSRHSANRPLFTSVRFGNVLGSRGSVVPLFTRQIEQGGPVTVTHPDMTRYFMSIPEAANLIIHAACLTEGGDTFVLKMGNVVRILDLAERMIRLCGLRPGIDIEVKFTGIRRGEKMHEELYEQSEMIVETTHPHIVKVKNGTGHCEPDILFSRLDQLMAQPATEADMMLNRMLDVIRLNDPQPVEDREPSQSQRAS